MFGVEAGGFFRLLAGAPGDVGEGFAVGGEGLDADGYGLAVFLDGVGDFARGCHLDGESGAGGYGGAGDGEIRAVGFSFDGFLIAGDVPV